MKKIINDPEHVVSEMLAGIEISDSSLKYIPGFEVIARREPNKEKVAIISGGGSGHEPAHAGYVGLGMLDAAVAGNVFASPSPDRILEAIHQVGGDKGVLMVIKNYSGDIMNFSMAAELAEMEGYKVMSVGFVLADDEIEVGMGIHGEPGVERTSVKTSKELAEILCGHILADMDFSGSDCAVMVNGLGGTPLMELYILTNDVNALLREKGINPVRWYVGNYMTSLEMSGCSVSLLRLDDEMKAYLDAPAHTAAWRE